MMLDEVFKIIDQLTPEQQQVKWYIDHRPESLRSEIDQLLATAQPTDLKAGTMDINRLMQAAQAMWDGLDDTELEAVVQAMNEEYIELDPDRAGNE